MLQPFFNPEKSYEANWQDGPFGAFSDGEVFKEKKEPLFTKWGLSLNTPFGIPAGPLLNGRFIKAALDKGFDLPMHKTVRTRKYPCHPWPNILAVEVENELTIEKASKPLKTSRIFQEPLSITNSFGNPSQDPDYWQEDIRRATSFVKEGQIISGSIEGTRWPGFSDIQYIQDWATGAHLLKEAGVKIVEANFSCPNEGVASLLCFDIPKVVKIVEAIKEKIGNTPLFIKMAYFQDKKMLKDMVRSLGKTVQGFSVINTISAEVVDSEGKQALPGERRKYSGVCGSSIKWAGLDMGSFS